MLKLRFSSYKIRNNLTEKCVLTPIKKKLENKPLIYFFLESFNFWFYSSNVSKDLINDIGLKSLILGRYRPTPAGYILHCARELFKTDQLNKNRMEI